MEFEELKLPADLCHRLRRKYLGEGSGRGLESFVTAVLEELAEGSVVEEREEELLAERLRSLGYLSRD